MPYLDDGDVVLHLGDCVEVMAAMPAESVDAVVTDPPYGLEFMGKEWDAPWRGGSGSHAEARTRCSDEMGDENKRRFIASAVNAYQAGAPFQAWCETWATEALRVLKPGGHLLAFGGTRTFHRLTCAIEDAGFEVRDCLSWLYGSGFPKSLDVSKAIDKAAGAEREVVGTKLGQPGYADTDSTGRMLPQSEGAGDGYLDITAPATPEAARWQGWGTALKPAWEPIVVARKPLAGTVAANVLEHGTGAINVDWCRVEGAVPSVPQPDFTKVNGRATNLDAHARNGDMSSAPNGRWPANVVLDEQAAEMLDEANTGGPSRFFYTAKASSAERDGATHPTVKPLALMRWLVRLVTPPGGVVLDPFAGSGTTLLAARQEHMRAIGIEREAEYAEMAAHRLRQLSLFGGPC